MLVAVVFLSLILQGGWATSLNYKSLGDKCYSRNPFWSPCMGCDSLGGGLGCGLGSGLGGGLGGGRFGSSKLGGFSGGVCPSLAMSSIASPRYLPVFSASTSQVPVFKSYYKPIVKTHLTKIPIIESKMNTLISKFPCLRQLYGYPSVSTFPLAKLSCLKSKLGQTSCSPYCAFC